MLLKPSKKSNGKTDLAKADSKEHYLADYTEVKDTEGTVGPGFWA